MLIKPLGQTLVVAHDHKARASLPAHGGKQFKKAVSMQVVKGGGGLIGKNKQGLAHKRPGGRNTLLLTHRELMRGQAPELRGNTQLLKQAVSLV